jgi:hypothetical protein
MDLGHDFVIGDRVRNNLKDRAKWTVGPPVRDRDDEWTGLMRQALAGDGVAYHRLLKAVTILCRTFCGQCI